MQGCGRAIVIVIVRVGVGVGALIIKVYECGCGRVIMNMIAIVVVDAPTNVRVRGCVWVCPRADGVNTRIQRICHCDSTVAMLASTHMWDVGFA